MKQGKIYKCDACGCLLEILYDGGGLQCCGNDMQPIQVQSEGEKAPTHKPVIENIQNGIRIKIGSVPHTMDPDHYISWIEVEKDGVVSRKFLKPGEPPSASFSVSGEVTAREFCTTHGYWSSEE